MRKLLVFVFTFFTLLSVNAQLVKPVKWKSSIEKKSEDEFLLKFEAIIDEEWHIFSQFTPEGASLPSVFTFLDTKGNYDLIGKTKESPYKKVYSPDFGVDEYLFENSAKFSQLVKIKNYNLKTLKVEIEYQACKSQCIQLYETFEFKIPAITIPSETTNSPKEEISSKIDTAAISTDTLTTVVSNSKSVIEKDTLNQEPHSENEEKKGLLSIFFLAFLGGFAALLTPCVFPMIPLTVSFFTKQSGSRQKGIFNALFYGFSIILIYVALGSLIVGIFGADALNQLSTSVLFNVLFFIILVFFAASFLGAFEIVLPQSWANKVDAQAGKTGLVAIFFMALALAIVSFSCTGPIVGTLLVEASSKGGIAPIVGMLGFSFAIALPFMLFALFPGWLKSLPKSGGWMNTVKVSLGFLELALAFKFLSNADLVLQLHWFEREIFIAIWIAVFGAWALYLFGKFSLPHDSNIQHISVGRLFMGLLVVTFTVYLIPGLWGAPLKIISGFPPPLHYSESPKGVGGSHGISSGANNLPDGAKSGAHGIMSFIDYDKGIEYAKKVNKPVLLDFTGFACVNCRKMEDYVWSDPEILKILNNDVVLISLYVDDKKELPENEKYISPETGRSIKSIGNKWSDFQITKYKANAQPYYLVLDSQGNTLSNHPESYNPNIEEYKTWLLDGISKFKK